MITTPSSEILTLEQVAVLTGRSPNTLRAYLSSSDAARRRRIPPGSYKAPGSRRWLWQRTVIEAWLHSGQPAQRRGRPTKTGRSKRRDGGAS